MRNLLVGAAVALSLAGCAVQAQHPAPLAGEDRGEYLREMQDRAWYDVGGDARPQVEPTPVPGEELERVFDECLAAAQLSREECSLSFVAEPADIGYLSSSELNYVYDYYASELVPCLATQGLNVGYAPPRSEFAVAGWMRWDPYSELGAELPPSRADAIREACPPYPPMPFTGAYG